MINLASDPRTAAKLGRPLWQLAARRRLARSAA